MPKGKIPIEIFSSRETPNQLEQDLIRRLEKTLEKSSKFRITNKNENRIVLTILLNEYIPSVVSTDVWASSTPIKTFSFIWLAKPSKTHGYVLWHDSNRFQTLDHLVNYILQQADTMVLEIKTYYPDIFS